MIDGRAAAIAAHLAKSGEAVKSGPIGLGVILLLCVACYFLFKSMSKHLRTVREDFPQDNTAKTQRPGNELPSQPSTVKSVELRKTPGETRAANPPVPPVPPVPPAPPVHP